MKMDPLTVPLEQKPLEIIDCGVSSAGSDSQVSGQGGETYKFGFHKRDLNRHESVHSREKYYKCAACKAVFNRPNTLKAHQLTVHEKTMQFKCPSCDYATFVKSRLKQHLPVHSGEKPYKCAACEAVFKRAGTLKVHQLSVHEVSKWFKCSSCDYAAFSKNSLAKHLRVHGGGRPYKCGVCDMAYKGSGALKTHQQAVHEKKRFICPSCGYAAFSKDSLVKHLRVHSGERPYKCEECDTAYKESVALKRHQQAVHEKKKRFICLSCGYATFYKRSLERHLTTHSGEKLYKCSECDAVFERHTQLKSHQLSVHAGSQQSRGSTSRNSTCVKQQRPNNKEGRLYKCGDCDYYASTEDTMNKHFSWHSVSGLFKCPVCGSLFRSLIGLRFHVLDHTGEAPYKCLLCGSTFKQKVLVKHHLAEEHQESQ